MAKVQHGELLLQDNGLVIAKDLQSRVIKIAHKSHQGIVKTKQLLREKVYFLESIKRLEELCQGYIHLSFS